MKERNIPAYVGDDYMAVAWPTTLRGLKNSLEAIHQYTESGIKLIFNGEIGRYENVRYTEQTNVSKGVTSTGASGTAWGGLLSDWIFFFGEDTVAEGVASRRRCEPRSRRTSGVRRALPGTTSAASGSSIRTPPRRAS
jgi:hypothetical protein